MVCLGGPSERSPRAPAPFHSSARSTQFAQPWWVAPAVGAGYWVLSSKVATLGREDFQKLPVETRAALSISHGSYGAHAGRTTLKDATSEREHFVRRVQLTLRRSAGGSESKSRSSSLVVDRLMTCTLDSVLCIKRSLSSMHGRKAPPFPPRNGVPAGEGCWCLAAMRFDRMGENCARKESTTVGRTGEDGSGKKQKLGTVRVEGQEHGLFKKRGMDHQMYHSSPS
jgi:hypothetical protein